MTQQEIKSIVDKFADIARVLIDADPDDKAEIFRQLGLKLTYHPGRQLVKAQIEAPHWYFESVRGPTRAFRARSTGGTVQARRPQASSTFEAFAVGVGLPPAARRLLGLAPTADTPSGDAGTPDDTKLSYPDSGSQATQNVFALWRVDLADATAFQRGRFDPRSWGDTSLRWLVDPGRIPDESPSGVRIGMGDVTRFRATVACSTT